MTADEVGHVTADYRWRRESVGGVSGLGGGRDHADQLAVTPQANDVHQVTGFESGEPNLDAADRALLERDDLRPARRALIND
jgi:hypothetical protein